MDMSDINRALAQILSDFERLIQENKRLREEVKRLREIEKSYSDYVEYETKCMSNATPRKVYHSKSRGNTTIVFDDGSSEKVTLMKGEPDCLDTAVAYALMKHMYPKWLIKNLLKNAKEVDECKKNSED